MGPKKKNSSSFVVPPNYKNSTCEFQEGDTVWCKWYSNYYRATITKATVQINGEQYYRIHYWKFAKNWDMTVPEKKLLAWTEENGKFVKNVHRELNRIKKKKKLEAKLIAEIQKNVREQKQRLFVALTDIMPLLKGYKPSENHHSAEEYVQFSSLSLTFVVRDGYYELKNSSTKSPPIEGFVQEKKIEPMIVDKDTGTPKTGLLKEFSSREKDVISVLDNMRTNTMRLRSRSSQKSDQEGIK